MSKRSYGKLVVKGGLGWIKPRSDEKEKNLYLHIVSSEGTG